MHQKIRFGLLGVCSAILALLAILILLPHFALPSARSSSHKMPSVKHASATPQVFKGNGTTSNEPVDELAILRTLRGSNGWAWHISLPEHRIVAFYGNPLSPVMGPIG